MKCTHVGPGIGWSASMPTLVRLPMAIAQMIGYCCKRLTNRR